MWSYTWAHRNPTRTCCRRKTGLDNLAIGPNFTSGEREICSGIVLILGQKNTQSKPSHPQQTRDKPCANNSRCEPPKMRNIIIRSPSSFSRGWHHHGLLVFSRSLLPLAIIVSLGNNQISSLFLFQFQM